jgi:hypothetical protein
VSQLLPEGTTLKDAPHSLFDAIRQALIFLGFQDLPNEERPDRKIWHNADALKEHFEAVKKRWEEKMDPDGKGEVEDPVDNAAAKGLLIGG